MKITLTTFLSGLILTALLSCGGNRFVNSPMKAGKFSISDNEMLTYTYYSNGERNSIITIVIKTNKDPVWGNTATMYEFFEFVTNMRKPPENYSDFDGFQKVSLDKATLVEETRNWEFAKKEFKGFPYYQHYELDARDETYNYTAKSWSGSETRESRSRISLKNKMQYPIWTMQSLVFIGLRFLDTSSPGIFYLVEPWMMKEPMPVRGKYLGSEDIETKAGRFRTRKEGMDLADVFIGRLLEPYTKNMIVWADVSSGRIIKIKGPGEEDYLDSISIFTNKKK